MASKKTAEDTKLEPETSADDLGSSVDVDVVEDVETDAAPTTEDDATPVEDSQDDVATTDDAEDVADDKPKRSRKRAPKRYEVFERNGVKIKRDLDTGESQVIN